jgi:ABC-2 type transport system ATP-binding protein
MTAPNLIEARDVSLRYGRKLAVDNVSFNVPSGRVVGLLGHNGAGKTSLMKALVGLLPCAGELRVLGLDPRRDRQQLLESICYIPDVAILPRWARVQQLITLMGGLHPRFSAERARSLQQTPPGMVVDAARACSRERQAGLLASLF